MKNKIDKFIIDRSEWRCGGNFGHGKGDTALLNREGFKCCLGFFALSCGYSEDDIYELGEPSEIDYLSSEEFMFPDWFGSIKFDRDIECYTMKENNIVKELINTNDDENIDNEEREKQIKEKFLQHGVTVTFEGKYIEVGQR